MNKFLSRAWNPNCCWPNLAWSKELNSRGPALRNLQLPNFSPKFMDNCFLHHITAPDSNRKDENVFKKWGEYKNTFQTPFSEICVLDFFFEQNFCIMNFLVQNGFFIYVSGFLFSKHNNLSSGSPFRNILFSILNFFCLK